jgi:hypothetical protein
MELDELVTWIRSNLADVQVVVASQDNGAPEGSWGDVFVMHDVPAGTETGFPFATIVIQDQPGFDDRSRLDRAGAFRVNIQVGRGRAAELLGVAVGASKFDEVDFAEFDRLLPHPVYAAQGYVSVVNPGEATTELVLQLLQEAHARSRARLRPSRRHRRGDAGSPSGSR